MKNPVRLLVALAATLIASQSFAQVATWNFFGETQPAVTSTADTIAANLDMGASFNTLTRGPGATATSATNSFRTQGFQNNGISTANTDYFQFIVSAATGYTLSLSSISANLAGTASFGAAPGVSMQFAYSTDGSTFTLIGSPFTITGASGSSGIISLAAISALQNIDAATSITMRFYASGQTTTGGWGFTSASAGVNGLTLAGSVDAVAAAIPEPSTYAAIFGAVALTGAAYRRRQQAKAARAAAV